MTCSKGAVSGVLLAIIATYPGSVSAETIAPPTFQSAVDEHGLDMKTGRFAYSPPPLIAIGGAEGLSLTYSPSGGRGLIHNFYREIHDDPAYPFSSTPRNVTIQFGNLAETFRGQTSQGPFTPEYPTGSSLVYTSGYLKYTDRLGMEIHFEPTRTRVAYPDGRELIVHGNSGGWAGSPNMLVPTAVTSNYGYMLKFSETSGIVTIQAVNQAVDYCNTLAAGACSGLTQTRSATSQHAAIPTRYLTDAAGNSTTYRLRSIYARETPQECYPAGPQVVCTTPPYKTEYYLAGVTFPGRSQEDLVVDYGNGPWDSHDGVVVQSITRGDISVNYQVQFDLLNIPPTAPSRPYHLLVTAQIGGQTTHRSLAVNPNAAFAGGRRTLAYVRDGLDRFTHFGNNAVHEISSATYAEGNSVGNQYDSRNNIVSSTQTPKANSGLSTLSTTRTYASSCSPSTQATCNLPLTVVDPKGNTTDFTYNTKGQALTETGPAPAVGAVRPKTTFTYTLRTAYIKNSSGAAVAAGQPVSLLTKMSTCRTLSSCAGTTDEVVTEYDYGPTSGLNTLRLRGMMVTAANTSGQMETLRTCYTYDYFGDRVSVTSPNANLSSCS